MISVRNLKDIANESIHKTETLTAIENKLMVTNGAKDGKDKLGVWR